MSRHLPSQWLSSVTRFDVTADEARLADAFVSMLDAAGVVDDIVYLSTPITTGYRWYELLAQFGGNEERARLEQPGLYQRSVLVPNAADAAHVAGVLRAAHTGRTVLNPAELHVPGASQNFYNGLWARIILGRVTTVTLADGWAFSSGARMEATIALQHHTPVQLASGAPIGWTDVERGLECAFAALIDLGLQEAYARRALSIALPRTVDD